MSALSNRRIVVVGASSGIGAAFARAALSQGAAVTVSARRADRIERLIADHDLGSAVAGDATSRADMDRVCATAAHNMGGLDLLLYAAGYGVLQRMRDCDPDTWLGVYAVNVIGANLAAAAAFDHMTRDSVCAFVSSRTTIDANAYFASYSASKAALDQCIRTWRTEHPDRRFVRIQMGNTQPTEFANHMGADLLGDALTTWEADGVPGGMMDVDDVAASLATSLGAMLDHPEIDASELKLDARTA